MDRAAVHRRNLDDCDRLSEIVRDLGFAALLGWEKPLLRAGKDDFAGTRVVSRRLRSEAPAATVLRLSEALGSRGMQAA